MTQLLKLVIHCKAVSCSISSGRCKHLTRFVTQVGVNADKDAFPMSRYKAGQTEKVILRKLGSLDPDGKRHVIRLLRHFDYRGHLCLVFEPMVRYWRDETCLHVS